MKDKIQRILDVCEDWSSQDLIRLIGELEEIQQDKESEELEETIGAMDRF